MDTPAELGEFLRTRRARLKPEDVGLVSYGAQRRVPGLRREELAQLAGVSAAYYARLEQGQSGNASEAVLDALARALRLSGDEHSHLRNLARPGRAKRRPPDRAVPVRPGTKQLIDAMDGVPAIVLDRRSDVLAWNPLGHALVGGHLDFAAPERHTERPNLQRLLFLDPHTRELYPLWDEEAKRAVSSLRLMAGRCPDDRRLAELVGELLMKSPEFAALWQRHPVRNCVSGVKSLHHPLVGPMELSFETLRMPDESGQWALMYSAERDSPAEAGLSLLRTLVEAHPHPHPHPADASAGIGPGQGDGQAPAVGEARTESRPPRSRARTSLRPGSLPKHVARPDSGTNPP